MPVKKYVPYLLAVALFAIITVIQFGPLFKGKVINQSDIVQYRGMSKEVIDYRKAEHKEALWTNSMFGGMPAYQVSPMYPGNWMTYLDRLFHLFLPHPSGSIFVIFLGFYILLLCLKIDPWLALVGSLAYGFSSYFFIILEVGHNSKAYAIGYLAPVLGGTLLLLQGNYWLGFALVVLFSALGLNANHVQISYYGYLVIALVFAGYFISAVKQKELKPFFIGLSLFVLASGIAVLPNAGNLLATNEYGKYTTRGKTELTINASLKPNSGNVTSGLDKSYATQYSYGISEVFTFLIPDYKGGPSGMPIGYAHKDALKHVDPELREQVSGSSGYFGVQDSTAGPVYLGAIVMLLAFLGLFIVHHPLKWPLVIATLFSMMLSWGKYFMGLSSFFMDYLPGYNKFRAVSMILVIAELTIPLLAILALDRLVKLSAKGEPVKMPFTGKEYSLKKMLIVSVAAVGGFCLLGYVMPDLVNSFSPPGEEEEIAQMYRRSGATNEQISGALPAIISNLEIARKAIFKSDALRSFIFIALAALALFFYLNKKLKTELLLLALGIFIMADMWPVVSRYLNKNSFVPRAQFEAPPQKTAADEQILADPEKDFRVLNLTVSPFQDATTSYYHKSIGGYHGAKLKKYDELISFHLFKEINLFSQEMGESLSSDSATNGLLLRLPVLNMLNTRYFILPTRTDEPAAFPNPQANGNAWLVKQIKTVNSADSEIVGLYRLDTKTQALVQQKNKPATLKNSYSGEGTIRLESYRPNYLVYETTTQEPEFAVFSEIYYPEGWNAFIDGKPAMHTCVNYLLRGMEIPAGKHRVEFKFEPRIYTTGNTLSFFGSILVLGCVAGSLYVAVKKQAVKRAA
jgi:hypothetical protein